MNPETRTRKLGILLLGLGAMAATAFGQHEVTLGGNGGLRQAVDPDGRSEKETTT